jgi:predicted SnoaL-like aldol condensation-catalyzing enzyme
MKQVITIALLFIFSACNDHQKQTNSDPAIPSTSATEKNKELIKRVYADMANKQNYALIDSFFAPNIFDHGALEGQQQGREGFKKAVIEFLGMFSQVEITVKEIIAEGDMVATSETWKVTMKSTNKVLTGETLHMFRIKDSLITDEWSKGWEWLGL